MKSVKESGIHGLLSDPFSDDNDCGHISVMTISMLPMIVLIGLLLKKPGLLKPIPSTPTAIPNYRC